jgi:hypothetical protein
VRGGSPLGPGVQVVLGGAMMPIRAPVVDGALVAPDVPQATRHLLVGRAAAVGCVGAWKV